MPTQNFSQSSLDFISPQFVYQTTSPNSSSQVVHLQLQSEDTAYYSHWENSLTGNYISLTTGNQTSSSSWEESSASPESSSNSPDYLPETTFYDDTLHKGNQPYLQILEQPHDKFRFRYKTEMQGCHGAIQGESHQTTKNKTYPKVQLCNCQETSRVIIRCTLSTADSDCSRRVAHVHRLVNKLTGEEKDDDPHDIVVAGPESIAVFQNLTILYTKKEDQLEQLVRKKQRHILRKYRHLNNSIADVEDLEMMKSQAKTEIAEMNLNKVCLKFEALVENRSGILEPVCPPIYSRSISNLKNPQTSELKICRFSRWIGSCEGGQEVFMFVEKVVKKNIRVKFFEEGGDKEIVWEEYAEFGSEDVHHQYGITFRTPPYRDQEITSDVKVYFQLERPSDLAVSAPMEFKYQPNQNHLRELRRKRPRRVVESPALPAFEDAFQPTDFGLEQPQPVSAPQLPIETCVLTELFDITDLDGLEKYLNGSDADVQTQAKQSVDVVNTSLSLNDLVAGNDSVDQVEFARFIQNGLMQYARLDTDSTTNDLQEVAQFVQDHAQALQTDGGFAPKSRPKDRLPHIQMDNTENVNKQQTNPVKKQKRFLDENNILKITNAVVGALQQCKEGKQEVSAERLTGCLQKLCSRRVGCSEDSVFHVLAVSHDVSSVSPLNKLLTVLKTYGLQFDINMKNNRLETPLHLAVRRGASETVELLLGTGADINSTDSEGNTPVHLAILREDKLVLNIVTTLLSANPPPCLSICNEDGYSPLHLAVMHRKSTFVPLFLVKEEEGQESRRNVINVRDKRQGNTAIHIAVQRGFIEIVKLLLNYEKDIDLNIENFAGKTPISLIWDKEGAEKVLDMLMSHKVNSNLVQDDMTVIKEEIDIYDDKKFELYAAEELEESDFEEKPEVKQEFLSSLEESNSKNLDPPNDESNSNSLDLPNDESSSSSLDLPDDESSSSSLDLPDDESNSASLDPLNVESNSNSPDLPNDSGEEQSEYAKEWNEEFMDKSTISKLCRILDVSDRWVSLMGLLLYSEEEIKYCYGYWSPSLMAFKMAAAYKTEITPALIRDKLKRMSGVHKDIVKAAHYIDQMIRRQQSQRQ